MEEFDAWFNRLLDLATRDMERFRLQSSVRVTRRVLEFVYPAIVSRVSDDYEAVIADLEFQLAEAQKPATRRKTT